MFSKLITKTRTWNLNVEGKKHLKSVYSEVIIRDWEI